MRVTYTLQSFVVSRVLSSASLKAGAERHCPRSRLVKGLTDPQNVNCFRAAQGKHIQGQYWASGDRAVEKSGIMKIVARIVLIHISWATM
jgi:hypothetical protein